MHLPQFMKKNFNLSKKNKIFHFNQKKKRKKKLNKIFVVPNDS